MSEHEPFIKTPRQLITVVTLAFIVPNIVIVLLVKYVGSSPRPAAGSEAFTAQSIEARIRPVAGFVLRGADGPKVLRAGEEVYKAQCGACHEVGAAGAPKLGDAAAWAPRIKTGYAALHTSVLKGKGAMAAQAGGEYDDVELGRAVVYMANKAGANFPEPKGDAPAAAPAAAAPAPAAAAPAPAPMAAVAAVAAAPAAAPAADGGKKLYDTACVACHVAGVAGAPKLGDKAAWAPRLALGVDGLTASVVKGKGAMPPKGGSSASEAEIKSAVQYMVASVK
ncbi:MAG: c-type cytochrome [Burkholderiaceae bacterium]